MRSSPGGTSETIARCRENLEALLRTKQREAHPSEHGTAHSRQTPKGVGNALPHWTPIL
jgi:hypothetical protein